MSEVLMRTWPICVCRLPMKGICGWARKLDPVTLDLGGMTLTSTDTGGDR